MKSFAGKLAVVTGGGSGIGRELVRQLVKEGCSVASCDVSLENLEQTRALCETSARCSIFEADVSLPAQVLAFRDAVTAAHDARCIHLLINNAGIAGGGSFVDDAREEWEKTFDVCWGGVYHGCRAFLPLLLASDAGWVVNVSSVNGFWASLGPNTSHTAYSAAKFAVKGFSEALLTDFRNTAPHLGVSVVMPGHIGTSIVLNSGRVHGRPDPKDMSAEDVAEARARLKKMGLEVTGASDDDIRRALQMRVEEFRDDAPTSAAEAATQILDGVRAGRWRILIGDDARVMDEMVRATPEAAYEAAFMDELRARANWKLDV